jgi:hypothetical protein
MLTYKTLLTLALNEEPLIVPGVTKESIRIFPNPAKELLYVNGQNGIRKPITVQIYNLNGNKLFEKTGNSVNLRIGISSLSSGMYVVRVINGLGMVIHSQKFIKQ